MKIYNFSFFVVWPYCIYHEIKKNYPIDNSGARKKNFLKKKESKFYFLIFESWSSFSIE